VRSSSRTSSVAEQPSSRAAEQQSSRAAEQQSSRAAEQQSSRAAGHQSSRAAELQIRETAAELMAKTLGNMHTNLDEEHSSIASSAAACGRTRLLNCHRFVIFTA